MKHKVIKVSSFVVVEPYSLKVKFEDGKIQLVNLREILKGKLYSPLLDKEFFKKARLDEEIKTIIWPNGADFDPAILYDWHKFLPELKRLAEKW